MICPFLKEEHQINYKGYLDAEPDSYVRHYCIIKGDTNNCSSNCIVLLGVIKNLAELIKCELEGENLINKQGVDKI